MASSLPHQSPSSGSTQPRTGPDLLFDKAIAKFKKGLTKNQAQSFENCTLDDVKNEIKNIQSRHGSQRRLRNMELLSKFVEGMDQLGKVVEVFLNLHNTLAIVWGPLKLLLLTAKTSIDTLESLLDVYAQIGEVLPDLTRYEQIYKEYPAVHTHLEAYYCDILQFHSNALDVFARPCWKVFFHSAWKTFKTQFDPILKSLQRHRDMLSEEKLTAVMEETQRKGQSIQDGLDQLNRRLEEEYNKNIERDLLAHQIEIDRHRSVVESKINAPDYHEDYEIASQKRFQSTSGRWILSDPHISNWLDHNSDTDRKIYLSGIPGAGKTVLTSSVISHLKEQKPSGKDSGDRFSISYFYFKHSQSTKDSLLSLLLALLAQLVSQDESLLHHIYQSCCSAEPQQFRSLAEVSRHVSTALQSPYPIFVIIDGLDECREALRVLEWFESIMSNQDDTSGDTDYNIRLLISGQRDGILEDQMSHYTMMHLETSSGHDQDIKIFATTMANKIRGKFSLDTEAEQEIISRVTSKSGGMFLYAQLVLNNLFSQMTKYDLKQEMKAKTFPDGLNQAYDRVIIRVLKNPNKTERAVAHHILGMIMCACRPLHWREIQCKFCIDPSQDEINIERELVMSCKEICSSLVDVSYLQPSLSSSGEEVIDLVHSSAKTYLVQSKEIDIETENAQMALFCTEYMMSRPLTPGLSKPEIQEYAIKGYYGFHDYAVAFWWDHVQQVLAASELDTELSEKVLQTAHRCVISTGDLEQDGAYDGSSEVLQSTESKLQSVPQNLRDWQSIEIYEMRLVAVRIAIEGLINQPNEHDRATLPLYGPWRYRCRKPWCQFFDRGFEEAQQQKLHMNQHELPFTCEYQGCPAIEAGFEKETDLKNHTRRWHPQEEPPLFPVRKRHTKSHPDILKAAKTGDLDTIKDLIENRNISPDHHKKNGKSILQVAVGNGHLHIVRYLIEMGANINIHTWSTASNDNIFDTAINRRDFEIVMFLCDLGNSSPHSDVSALSILSFPQEIMLRVLRLATPEYLKLVLFHAIKERRTNILTYFLEHIDAPCFDYALHLALRTCNIPYLDALLSSGKTDPNAADIFGQLPLHYACASGQLRIVQSLYAVTTETYGKDILGYTPLDLASTRGHDTVVEFLIENGADVNAENDDSKTPLQLATEKGHEEVRRRLLDCGAKLDSVDNLAGSSHDHNKLPGIDKWYDSFFDSGGMELANPLNSGEILNDFDFDSL
ncbi:hypothetical protein FSST1_006444 [Fusarium sambucinum]